MERITVVKWQEGVNLKNFSRESIFDSIQEIDRSVFHENGLADKQSDIDRYEAYKDSYLFALDGSKIVGYLCYFPKRKDRKMEYRFCYSGYCFFNNNCNNSEIYGAGKKP